MNTIAIQVEEVGHVVEIRIHESHGAIEQPLRGYNNWILKLPGDVGPESTEIGVVPVVVNNSRHSRQCHLCTTWYGQCTGV